MIRYQYQFPSVEGVIGTVLQALQKTLLTILAVSTLMNSTQALAATTSAAMPSSFAGYNIHDEVTVGSGSSAEAFAVISKLSGSGKYYTDLDGVKFYERDIFVAKVSNNQFVLSESLGRLYISNATLSVDGAALRVFFNHKMSNSTYTMSGKLTLMDKSNLSIVNQSVLFSDGNWGWYPKFVGSDVEHFSYAGYYRMLNSTNKGSVTPASMAAEYANYVAAHSQGVIPSNIADSGLGPKTDAANAQIVAAIFAKLGAQSFLGYNIHDVVTEGSGSSTVVYALISKFSGSGKYYTDLDGVKFYERDIFLAKVTSSQFLLNEFLGRLYISNATLSVENSIIRIFFNHKMANSTYSMAGYVNIVDKSTLRLTSQNVLFSDGNWGWYPKFVGSDVEHFSYAGYYRMLNSMNKGSVTPASMSAEYANYVAAHSQGIIPSNVADSGLGPKTDAVNAQIAAAIFAKLSALCASTLENLGVSITQNSALTVEMPNITLCGGIQVKTGTRQTKVTENLNDDVDVRGTININTDSYIGQAADIVVTAIYTPLGSTASLNFMLDERGVPLLWEKTLVPFKSNVTLSKTQEVVMYKGKFVGTGRLLVYLGLRLKKDGIVISHSTPIDIFINP